MCNCHKIHISIPWLWQKMSCMMQDRGKIREVALYSTGLIVEEHAARNPRVVCLLCSARLVCACNATVPYIEVQASSLNLEMPSSVVVTVEGLGYRVGILRQNGR